MLINRTVTGFLDAFAASDPTPGGGSASAMAGAMAASLLAMVSGMAKTRTNAIAERAALDEAHGEIIALREQLTALIDRDADAYDLVVAAFRKPKVTDADKAARTAAIQDATRVATEIPLETMRACAALIRLEAVVAANGNQNAASDVHVAGLLARTGLRGALSNVHINVPGITDPALATALKAQADRYAAALD